MIQIREGKQVGILYHYTSVKSLLSILEKGELRGSYIGQDQRAVSLTRDKHFEKTPMRSIDSMQVRIVLDGDKLSDKYKIEPFNDFAHRTWPLASKHLEAEERIIGNIEEINQYVKRVEFLESALILDSYSDFRAITKQMMAPQYSGKIDDRMEITFDKRSMIDLHLIAEYILSRFKIACLVGTSRVQESKLQEAKQVGVIYHYTSIANLLGILKTNSIRPWGVPNGDKDFPNSFTRNKNFHRVQRILESTIEARLVLDGDKLSEKYKIEPYSDLTITDPAGNLGGNPAAWYLNQESEERISKEIKDISRYLIKVDLLGNSFNGTWEKANSLAKIRKIDPFFEDMYFEDITLEYLKAYIIDKYNVDCDILEG